MQKSKTVVTRSMAVEALSCKAGARASIHPFRAPSPRRKHPMKSCLFAAPHWRRKKSGRNQKSSFAPKPSRFSSLNLMDKCLALPWLVDDQATYTRVRSATRLSMLQYLRRLSATVSPPSRVPQTPKGHHTSAFGRDAPDETFQTQPSCLSTNRLGRVDSWFVPEDPPKLILGEGCFGERGHEVNLFCCSLA